MTKISAFTIIIILLSVISCSESSQSVHLLFKDVAVDITVPPELQETNAADFKEGIVPYKAVFEHTEKKAFFGVFPGPPLSFGEEDLAFYTDYIETQYGNKYTLLSSAFGENGDVHFFKFRQKSNEDGSFREFYLVSTDDRKFSVGVEGKFRDENYSLESIVETTKIK